MRRIKVPIKNKIFSIIDIEKIYITMYKDYANSKSEYKEITVDLKYENQESESISNEKIEIIKDILTTKKILYIGLNLNLSKIGIDATKKYIDIEMFDGNSNYLESVIYISSTDSSWINDKKESLNTILDGVTPQDLNLKKLTKWTYHLLRLSVGYSFWIILAKLVVQLGYHSSKTNIDLDNVWVFLLQKIIENKVGLLFLELSISYFVGLMLCLPIENHLDKMISKTWPSIELNLGPKHKRQAMHNRRIFGTIISLVLFPLILQIVFKLIGI